MTIGVQKEKVCRADVLRGGLYKLRTRPDAFQGLGRDAFPMVKSAKTKTGLPFLTEITSASQVEALVDIADFIMVGTRNMYNYDLLHTFLMTSSHSSINELFCASIGRLETC